MWLSHNPIPCVNVSQQYHYALARCRGRFHALHAPHLLRLWGFEATVADLRAYATLFWVGKTLLTGYTIVSLQNRESTGAVRARRKVPNWL